MILSSNFDSMHRDSGRTSPTAKLYSPFDALPDDAVARIVHFARDYVEYEDVGDHVEWKTPYRQMLVSRRWLKVILQAPTLWSTIGVIHSTPLGTITMHLKRSATSPITIWIHKGAIGNREALRALRRQMHRWEGLFVESTPGAAADEHGNVTAPTKAEANVIDIGRWLTGQMGYLRFLHIEGMSASSSDGLENLLELPGVEWLSYKSTVPRFRLAAPNNLKELRMKKCSVPVLQLFQFLRGSAETLRGVWLDGLIIADRNRQHLPKIHMHKVTDIFIRCYSGYHGLGEDVLSHITAPNIRSWTYRGMADDWKQWAPTDKLEFQELEKLDLEGQHMPPQAFSSILSAAPNLRRIAVPFMVTPLATGLVVDMLHEYGMKGHGPLVELKTTGWSLDELRDVVRANIRSLRKVVSASTYAWDRDSDSNSTHDDTIQWLRDHLDEMCFTV